MTGLVTKAEALGSGVAAALAYIYPRMAWV
jgi:hypothetical protein